MRDVERISEVLHEVERLWRLHPDWRLGQLIANVSAWANESPWDLEEDVLIAEIKRHLAEQASIAETP